MAANEAIRAAYRRGAAVYGQRYARRPGRTKGRLRGDRGGAAGCSKRRDQLRVLPHRPAHRRGQIDEAQAIVALVGAVERMQHVGPNVGRDVGKVEPAIAAGKKKPWEERDDRAGDDRPLTFTGLLGIARAVSEARVGRRRSVTRWGALRAAGLVRNREMSADLAHRVLFEAAMRNGLPATEAGAIIERCLRSAP